MDMHCLALQASSRDKYFLHANLTHAFPHYWCAESTGLQDNVQGPSIQRMARRRSASNVIAKTLVA